MDQETSLDVVDGGETSTDQEVDIVYPILDGRRLDGRQISTVSRLLVRDRLVLDIDV